MTLNVTLVCVPDRVSMLRFFHLAEAHSWSSTLFLKHRQCRNPDALPQSISCKEESGQYRLSTQFFHDQVVWLGFHR